MNDDQDPRVMPYRQLSLIDAGGARFNAERTHRYELWRPLGGGHGTACFIMLNPSDADDHDDDPTIRLCKGYASRWGYGMLRVVNLYSFISTDPGALYTDSAEKTGNPENLATIVRVARSADIVVAAWGNHAYELLRRGERQASVVLEMFLGRLTCLAVTSSGCPHHPLRLRKDLKPQPYHYTEKKAP